MAILSSSNLLSEQRYDISDARRIESAVRNDFDTTVTSIFTNTTQGYILRGFSIPISGSIGSPANGLQLVVDPGAVLHIDASVSGTIFQTPTGTPNQTLNAATNTQVSGSFTANATNYVGIDYSRFADSSTNVTKYIWSATSDDEIPTIAPAAQTLTYQIYITTSVWAPNVLPIAIVTTDSNGNVTSITDARWMLCSLETGGVDPNPSYVYPWSAGRVQPPVTTTSNSVDPFNGGDKQLSCLKDWMNAIMSVLLEIKGTPQWFSGSSTGVLPSLQSLFQDLGNTVITGTGNISNGILPNAEPILVTTGNIATSSNQLTSLGSTAGLANGDYIFATGIPTGTFIENISGSTITMSQNATLAGTGISVTFYAPAVITSPGQINWDDPINIRVIGSSLTYVLAANASSTDITLSDDEVAYVTLIRNVAITPNLIFTAGSNVVSSVGNVSWTAGLLAGDYIKLATNPVSGYYQIASITNSSSVVLTTNVVSADNTGSSGAQAQYAFGSYSASPTPSTNRNIYIATRETVPTGGNVFWLFMREDNGGNPGVYIRFLAQEINNGQSIQVSGTTSQQLLQYIGSPSAAAFAPQYVNSINPGSLPQITSITTGAGSTVTGGQYFTINSSGNARMYAVWFKVSGSGSMPSVAGVNTFLEVDILSSDTAAQVATKLALALNTPGPYIDFNASASSSTVTVTNTSAGACNPAANGNVGVPFAVNTTQSGTGTGNFFINDGDNLTLAIKKLDEALGNLEFSLDSPTYDEVVEIVASGATPPISLNGPISSGTDITLPNNSRESNIPQYYTVGKGSLMVFLNGQFMDVESGAYTEVGGAGTASNQIQIQFGLVVGDELEFRISGGGGGGGGGGAGPQGPEGPPGTDAAGGPIAISTKNSNYTALTSDNFLLVDCTSAPVTITLPTASSATGRILYIKKIDSSGNAMTIKGNGSDLIDGSNTIVVSTQYQEYSMVSNGTQWWIF